MSYVAICFIILNTMHYCVVVTCSNNKMFN